MDSAKKKVTKIILRGFIILNVITKDMISLGYRRLGISEYIYLR